MGVRKDRKYNWLWAKLQAVKFMNSLEGVEKYKICGSIRRKKDTVGDIDVVAIIEDDQAFRESVISTADKILVMGEHSVRFIRDDVQIDILIATPDYFESVVFHFTGSKAFNVKCRVKARSMGFKLNEYGLWDKDGNKVDGSEIGIIDKLGINPEYMDPTKR